MNGAEGLVSTLAAGGIEVCFTNPGTSEMHIVAALDRPEENKHIRCVLGLFEGVVSGAADGYARMTGKPACTLLHLAPGLANGIANFHNAARAYSPIVSLVGNHPAGHLRYDSPLKGDIEAVARPYSKWLRTLSSSADAGKDAAEAMVAACSAPCGIATLVVPADVAWSEGGASATILPIPKPPLPSGEAIERARAMLRSGQPTAILLTGDALHGKGLAAAGCIAAATGAALLAPYAFPRLERGAGAPVIDRTPYVREQAMDFLKPYHQIIFVGAPLPVSHFAYPGKNSVLTPPGCEIHTLASPSEDCTGALQVLADALSIPGGVMHSEKAARPALPSGAITLPGLAAAIAATLPEDAIVADESMTSGRAIMPAARGCPHHDWLASTGGSIGIALPLAVGAAVACPGRPVFCLTADGSGMYTLQSLWTIAREGLNVTTVIFANKSYGILRYEFSRLGMGEPGSVASDLFNIGGPDLDWVCLAKGMGVPGARVSSLDEFTRALRNGYASGGPSLIEVPL